MIFGSAKGNAQIITTICGTGAGSSSGDWGAATSASLYSPSFVSLDSLGNIYFGDGPLLSNPRIRCIRTDGIIVPAAGGAGIGFSGDGGVATNAKLKCPSSYANKVGELYIADYTNYRLRKVNNTSRIINTIAGNGTATSTGDRGPATDATLVPTDVITDDNGNIFILDNTRVRKINTRGIISTIAGHGSSGFSGDGGLATDASLTAAGGVCFDRFGRLLIVCNGGTRIRAIDTTTGRISTFAGNGSAWYNGDEIRADTAHFKAIGICSDSKGNVLISDYFNNRIRQIDTFGFIHTVVGTGTAGFRGDGGPATSALINQPYGVAVDRCGDIYICDETNGRIRKVTYPHPLTDTPTISIRTETDSMCQGTTITLLSIKSGGGTHSTYQWTKNSLAIVGATDSFYTFTPINGDTIRCNISSWNSCFTPATNTSNSIVFHVIDTTTPTISISVPSVAPIGTMVTANASITGTSSYLLHWRNHNIEFATTSVPSVTYTKTLAIDSISAHLVPLEMCVDSTIATTMIVTDTNLGVSTLEVSDQLKVFPSLTKDMLFIHSNTPINSLKIIDLLGRELITQNDINAKLEVTIDVKNLKNGVFLVQINDCIPLRFIKNE